LSQMFRSCEANSGTIQRKRGMFKKAVQQGRRAFGARSVHGVREHAKSLRTQLAAFFNIPRKGSEDLATPSASTVDSANLGQTPNPPISEKGNRLPLSAMLQLVLAVLLLTWSGFFTMDFLLSGVFTFPRTSRAFTLTFAVIILSYEFIYEEHRTRYSSITGIPPLKVVLFSCMIPYMVGSLALLILALS